MRELSYKTVAKSGRKRVRNDDDFFVVIDGRSGKGKTTLSYHLAKIIQPSMTLEKNFLGNPDFETVMRKIKDVPRYGVVVLDEAIKILFKQRWYSKVQQMLKIVYNVNRAENKITIANIPKFLDLNSSFRNEKVHLWIHVFEKGKAVVFYPSRNPFKSDPWDLSRNAKIFDYQSKSEQNIEEDWNSFLHKVKKTKAYAFHFDFPDWDDESVKQVYEKMFKTQEVMYSNLGATSKSEQNKIWISQRNRLVYILYELFNEKKNKIKIERELTHNKIAHILKIETSTVTKLLDDEYKKGVNVNAYLHPYIIIENKDKKSKKEDKKGVEIHN